MFKKLFKAMILLTIFSSVASADERLFSYSYEPDVLPKGGLEFEQWITNKAGREEGDYSQFEFREELEYGITDRLTTALYLNFKDTYFSPKDSSLESEREFKFSGISSEWKYQILNPYLNPIGFLIYGEATVDSEKVELEERLVFGKYWDNGLAIVSNIEFEQEWEFEHGETEKESKLTLTAGVSYKVSPHWATGLEIFNERKFEGIDMEEFEAQAWYLGPVLHYGTKDWWVNLTVAPQIPLEGGDRNLDDFERIQTRLLVGIVF